MQAEAAAKLLPTVLVSRPVSPLMRLGSSIVVGVLARLLHPDHCPKRRSNDVDTSIGRGQ